MIEILTGPMFSGKTSTALSRACTFVHAKNECVKFGSFPPSPDQELFKVLFISHSTDKRPSLTLGDSEITTHSKIHKVNDDIISVKTHSLYEILIPPNVISIVIDEAQFFEENELYNFLIKNKKEKERKIKIFVCGLDGDVEQKKMSNWISTILPISDSITKLSSLCLECQNSAYYTKYKGGDYKGVEVGGSEKYYSCCFNCL